MCEDAGPAWSRKGGTPTTTSRTKTSRNRSLLSRPAIHTWTDGASTAASGRAHQPAPVSAVRPSVRPPALRSPIARPRHRRGYRQRRRERTGDRRAADEQTAEGGWCGQALPLQRRRLCVLVIAAAAADRGKNHSCSSVSVAPLSQVDCCYSVLPNVGVKIARREAAGSKVYIGRLWEEERHETKRHHFVPSHVPIQNKLLRKFA